MSDTYLGPAPDTIEEATAKLIEIINEQAPPSMWDEEEHTFIAHLHHNLGQDIRNYWGLWSRDTELHNRIAGQFYLSHADDMSGLLLKSVYRTYHDLPLELEEEAANSLDFWAATLRGEPFTVQYGDMKIQVNQCQRTDQA